MNIYTHLKQDKNLEDGLARFEAIDPARSFIVQAPAGSGKTSLLTQRFLALLAVVEHPEQVVAMTFTKKAVSEMQLRILEALSFCIDTPELELSNKNLYEQNTWQLARLALQNNQNRGWNLLENPHRLRIRTLDSFNTYLVGQMPLLSKLGGQSGVTQDASHFYRIAASEALNTESVADAVTHLMGLVNGNRQAAEKMIVSMLAKRDQWMPLLSSVPISIQEGFEIAPFNTALQNLLEIVFNDLILEIESTFELLKPAKVLLDEFDGESLSLNFESPSIEDLPAWKRLIYQLFTQKGGVRANASVKANKSLTAKEQKAIKAELKGLLDDLKLKDTNGHLAKHILAFMNLPNAYYTDNQWLGIQELWRLLMTAAAHLKLVFRQNATTDFIEIAQAASEALGIDEQPTDLAQRLDYQIQHLLIDEFQDTSVSQFVQLKKLISGWSVADNHSLFIVGDPMQSIYRFREAEVGNFLEAWSGSIGQFPLERQQLTVNFRSKLGVVDWVNQTFKNVMPKQNVIEKGAVSYSPSTAFSDDMNNAVTTHWRVNQSKDDMVDDFVSRLEEVLKTKKSNESVGILGKTKSVLVPIAKRLKEKQIPFKAIEIEALADRQEIQDLESLTRSLLHLGDRPAWIALLRTPVIGLSLMDLSALLENEWSRNQPVWLCIKQHRENDFASLSDEGQQRLEKIYPILENAIEHIGLLSWKNLIKETWLALDFAQTLESAFLLQNIDAFWQMLAEIELELGQSGNLTQFILKEHLAGLFALPDSSEQAQQIEMMSMHKSKGLEFDYVFLPDLNKKGKSDDKQLVNWLRYHNSKGTMADDLIFAPMAQKGKTKAAPEDEKLVSFITNFEKQKQTYEQGRLFYVACTRAKQQLHLFANVSYTEKNMEDDKPIVPDNNGLLKVFWEGQKKDFNQLAEKADFGNQIEENEQKEVKVNRLALDRASLIAQTELELLLEVPSDKLIDSEDKSSSNPVEEIKQLKQQANLANMVTAAGNLVHHIFEQWGNQQQLPEKIDQALEAYIQYWLQQQSIADEQLEEATSRVLHSLNNAIKHPKLRWALTTDFIESENELPLSSQGLVFADKDSVDNVDSAHHIIDRTFVDENNVRWIVDYKTSYYATDMKISKQDFIAQQIETYSPQLARYAMLFESLENRKQIKVLYFSYLDEWVELAD